MTELSITVFETCRAIFFILLSVFTVLVLAIGIVWFVCYIIRYIAGYFITRRRMKMVEKEFERHLVEDLGFKVVELPKHRHEDSR